MVGVSSEVNSPLTEPFKRQPSLHYSLVRDPEPHQSAKLLQDSYPPEAVQNNSRLYVCCRKVLSLGVICYAAINN